MPSGTTRQWALSRTAPLAALRQGGLRKVVQSGDVVYQAGDRDYDFVVIESAEVDVVRPALPGAAEAHIARWGPQQFLGELGLLTGQSAIATTIVVAPG